MENIDKKINLLIAENIPSKNKGEATIFGGIKISLQCIGNVSYSMFSENPLEDLHQYPDVKIINIKKNFFLKNSKSWINKIFSSILAFFSHSIFFFSYKMIGKKIQFFFRSEIWKSYVESEIIIIGHNGSFGLGLTSVGSPLLFQHVYIPLFCKWVGKKVILYSGSIPKLDQGLVKHFVFLFRWVLNRLDLITLRCPSSYTIIKELKIKNENVNVFPDVAFLLEPSSTEIAENINHIENIPSKGIKVGIIVTQEKAEISNTSLNLQESREKHIDEISKFIDHIILKYNAHVIFIPHCIGIYKELDDRVIAQDIINKCHNIDNIINVTTEYSANDLKGFLGTIDFLISERIHAVVNAISMGTPSILVTNKNDNRKEIVESILDLIIMDIENFSTDNLIYFFDLLVQKKATTDLVSRLISQTETLRKKARNNGEAVKKLF